MGFEGLRIALVGPLPPPSGGMANQTRQLAALLRAEGAEVEVVQSNAPYRPAMVARVPMLRAAFRLVPYALALWRAAGRCEVMHVMANSGWAWHLFAVPALRIGRLRGRRVVVNYRGGGAPEFLARAHASVSQTLERTRAGLVVPSGFLRDVFARFGMAAEVVPNVVDLVRFHPPAERRSGPPQLLVARNLEALYDNATALRAFARVRAQRRDAQLIVAGSGPEAASLRRLAAELGIADAVTFTGRLDSDAMAALFREADLLLNPSRVDNMPNSLLEALASGVPVVSTDVGGVPYLVSHGHTAVLVPAGDDAAMAAAALSLLDDRAAWQRLSAAGLAEAQRYGWERVRGAWLDAYRGEAALAPRVAAS